MMLLKNVHDKLVTKVNVIETKVPSTSRLYSKTGGEGGRSPLPFFENQKSVLILEKKTLILFMFELNFLFKVQFQEYLGEKTPKFFLVGPFFLVFFKEMLVKFPCFHETSPTLKKFCLRTCKPQYDSYKKNTGKMIEDVYKKIPNTQHKN